MAVNKIVYNNKTLIDLTSLTVTPETLAEGVIAINAKGEIIVGTAKSINTWGDLANNGYIWDSIQGSDT